MMGRVGILRLDTKSRLSIGRYTEAIPGDYFHVEERAEGVLVLTPLDPFRGVSDAG